ncbi:hypothetical protein AKO1_008265, partial [Acrasis kona]
MNSLLFLVIVVIVLPMVTSELFNTILKTPNIRCANENDTTCYEKLFVPSNVDMLSTFITARFHLIDVIEYKELCSSTKNFMTIAKSS